MLDTLNPIFITILLVFFCTGNGRVLMIQSIRHSFYYAPISIRRAFTAYSILWLPHKLTRFLLRLAMGPIGNEKKWLHPFIQDTWKGVWIDTPKNLKHIPDAAAVNKDYIILYIHGGGFCTGFSTMYISLFQHIITQFSKKYQKSISILSVEYSLSPESVWPKACDQVVDAYRYLIHDLGINPRKIIIMGDSAGGNLVASTLLTLRDQRLNKRLKDIPPLPLPAAAVLISPWVDLSPVLVEQIATQRYNKDSLRPNGLEYFRSSYIPKLTTEMAQNPFISPLYGDFKGIHCPMFISLGEHEVLSTSIDSFITKLKKSGCDVTRLYGQDQSHIWLIYDVLATEKQVYQRDLDQLIDWIAIK